ncbi:MAG: hypothetical protein ABI882_20975, partial [Acidobacteriota bacterium]
RIHSRMSIEIRNQVLTGIVIQRRCDHWVQCCSTNRRFEGEHERSGSDTSGPGEVAAGLRRT